VHQFTVFASTTPMQHAIAEALHLPDHYFTDLATDYQRRRDFLMEILADAGLRPKMPDGSYFILAGIDDFPQSDGLEFSRFLVREIGVASIPLDSFYLNPEHGRKWVRFCFCKRWETLEAAGERLARVRSKV
jgi:aspartate/methionine/tyrosine aminotransferase